MRVRALAVAVGVSLLLVACGHTVGNCAHVNDLRAIAPPPGLTLLTANPVLGPGETLDAGHVYMVPVNAASTDLVVVWRSCARLNRLDAVETSTTVRVTVAVSGCATSSQGSTEPPEAGQMWFGGALHLAHSLGRRSVVSAPNRFCDTVTH